MCLINNQKFIKIKRYQFKMKKVNGDITSIKEFNLEKEIELIIQKYQVEVEKSIMTIFLPLSKNRTEKIYLSFKDKSHPILKLSKNLLYLGDPHDYLNTLKEWKQEKPVHLVEIIQELEQYLLNILGTESKLDFDLEKERLHVLNRARKFLSEKKLAIASYLYDYVADLSKRMGENGIADAYRNKVHKLRAHMRGEFIL